MIEALPPLVCGSCRTCCKGDTIALLPGDDPAAYKTKLVNGQRVLAKNREGDCVYLGKSGCQIHGRAPRMCRELDCRKYYLQHMQNPLGMEDRMGQPQTRATILEGRRRVLAARAA